MKKIIFIILAFTIGSLAKAQVVSMRVAQTSFDQTDPDGAGPATGSVIFRFEIISTANILADGMGLSAAFQSANLMATPTNTTVPLGPLAAGVGWVQGVDDRSGNTIAGLPMVGNHSIPEWLFHLTNLLEYRISLSPHPGLHFAQITCWTKGVSFPQGGYIVNEPGAIVANNQISSDGGLTTYDMESPNLNSPTALGAALPVLFTKFDAKCTNTGTLISSAAQEDQYQPF